MIREETSRSVFFRGMQSAQIPKSGRRRIVNEIRLEGKIRRNRSTDKENSAERLFSFVPNENGRMRSDDSTSQNK